MLSQRVISGFCLTLAVVVSQTAAESVSIEAVRDATLYEDLKGSIANGAGEALFAGRVNAIGGGLIRRALVAFDVASQISAGSTIESARLVLVMNKTRAGSHTFELHRVTTEWGEGTSDPPDAEGTGDQPSDGDATWIHANHASVLWNTPGGDFVALSSADTSVGGPATYEWTSAQMAADVQAWLDDPTTDFGWMIIGAEGSFPTAKRFASRETPQASDRPTLIVEFSPPACGDGKLSPGEDCDDGNNIDGDGCPSNCLIVHSAVPSTSGFGAMILALVCLCTGAVALWRMQPSRCVR